MSGKWLNYDTLSGPDLKLDSYTDTVFSHKATVSRIKLKGFFHQGTEAPKTALLKRIVLFFE